VKFGEGLGDGGEAVEFLPILDRGLAIDAIVGFLLIFELLLAVYVNDVPTIGHHTMFGGGEALEAKGTLQGHVDVLQCKRLKLDFGLALFEFLL